MKQHNEATRCKQCGKVIVGSSKMGLCDSCFNDDAAKAGGIAVAIGIFWKPVKKYVPKAIKWVSSFIRR